MEESPVWFRLDRVGAVEASVARHWRASLRKPKPKAVVPPARTSTLRESLRQVLLSGPATARDLSRIVGIPERSVPEHLAHLAKSLRPRGEGLEIEPSQCLDCDASFSKRERYTRPGRCPRCHSRRISLPRFYIKDHRKTR